MRHSPFIAGCLVLACPLATIAGPMPTLPDLPPLPTNYQSPGNGGAYLGVLSGVSIGTQNDLGISVVVGSTFSAGDLLWGVEALGHASSQGELAVEGGLRVGVSITDNINVFGAAGVGHSLKTDTYVSVGSSVEAVMGSGWLVRADYRYNHDLSGDAGKHGIMTGLLRSF